MSKANPRPWRLDGVTIRDAFGGVVMSAINPANMDTRRLIVRAVNALDADEPACIGDCADCETVDDIVTDMAWRVDGGAVNLLEWVKRFREAIKHCGCAHRKAVGARP